MYTYDMYRLTDMPREELLEKVKAKLKGEVEPPEVGGFKPDFATAKGVLFLCENSDQVTARMRAVQLFAEAGHTVVLVVPEGLSGPATEAWDFLPKPLQAKVKIMPIQRTAERTVTNPQGRQ